MKVSIFTFTFLLTTLLINRTLGQRWPRSESLLLFTPFDVDNGLTNLASNKPPENIYFAQLETTKPGPFGDFNASYTVSKTDSGDLCSFQRLPSFPSFTFSTYFYVSGRQQKGGIAFTEGPQAARFAVAYIGTSLEINRLYRREASQGFYVYNFIINNVFNNGWAFICFTYDDTSKTVTVHDAYGNIVHIENNFPIDDSYDTFFAMGRSLDNGSLPLMTNGDAMACTMIYNAILSKEEIAQLPEVCQRKGQPQVPDLWPQPNSLIGIWPLSGIYKLNNANDNLRFNSVSFIFH